MSLHVNNPGQNKDISTFMNEKQFCQGCDGFYLNVLYKKTEE